MYFQFAKKDVEKIKRGIRKKYKKVAKAPEGRFQYPTGKKGLEQLNYEKSLVNKLPDDVASFYCGVGNPFSLGVINTGESILDIGCGAGVDAILASMMTGPEGKVAGIDIVPEMLWRAKKNLENIGLKNVFFQKASGEDLPFLEGVFDEVISNGAINLIPDKKAALKEIFRVLKPGGMMMIADQILTGKPSEDKDKRIESWSH